MKKLLIYIIAYNHEKFIEKTFNRIDKTIFEKYETEILINEDSSSDKTLKIIKEIKENYKNKLKVTILSNPKNLGYGGNQKIGYHYAIKYKFHFVALLHGDGQYAPEILGNLVSSVETEKAKAVFGSRMISKFGALKGGMPLYKFIGNKILTYIQNKLMSCNLSEFHSGYRIYDVEALKKIPFNLNSDGYSFDTEIIIQFLLLKYKIFEYPIPTYYGDEISYVNGVQYAYQIIIETIKAKLQKYGIFYEKKFDLITNNDLYEFKIDFLSTHSYAIDCIDDNLHILDIGCNNGKLSNYLIEKKNCTVYGIDNSPNLYSTKFKNYFNCDLNYELPDLDYNKIDYVVFLDVIEHLHKPEKFMKNLYEKLSENENVKILISTPNISFFVIRLMLLFGSFNYGKKGILDKTHTRLFTFSSFKKLVEGYNFEILETKGIPAPFPLVFQNKLLGKILINLNKFLIYLWKSFFSYQIFLQIKPKPSLEFLLTRAKEKANQD